MHRFRESSRQRTLDIEGRHWSYVASGDGPHTVLFLPGGFSRADIWLHCILELESDYRVIATDASFEVFAARPYCRAALEIVAHEGVDRFSVVGVSYGGGLVQAMLEDSSERIDHAILSHCAPFEPRGARLLRRVRVAFRLFPARILRALQTRRRRYKIDSEWRDYSSAFMRELAFRVDKRTLLDFIDQSIPSAEGFVRAPDALSEWPGRVMILSSEDDRVSQPHLDKFSELYPGAQTHSFPDGGHAAVLLRPERHAKMVRSFLDKAYSQTA